jgi:hypothetical protein
MVKLIIITVSGGPHSGRSTLVAALRHKIAEQYSYAYDTFIHCRTMSPYEPALAALLAMEGRGCDLDALPLLNPIYRKADLRSLIDWAYVERGENFWQEQLCERICRYKESLSELREDGILMIEDTNLHTLEYLYNEVKAWPGCTLIPLRIERTDRATADPDWPHYPSSAITITLTGKEGDHLFWTVYKELHAVVYPMINDMLTRGETPR